ncbi:MAG: UDP-N-acetylmuramoyl-tripeptide--D-alanyl-D-alanine ligase [Epsilonproteobacteria bacterium]|nr:UDP-N-acetylmuramoyl-tripeptide--D-alanyl-D-alanine ligase [Campylobacterota bacterium]
MVEFLSFLIFVGVSGYYLITNLQWYSYKLSRVLFHHTKPMWNVVYFIIPFIAFVIASKMFKQDIVISLVYIILLYFWYIKLDKPLVWTGRVKRFFALLAIFALFLWFIAKCTFVMAPFILAFAASLLVEKILFWGFKTKAKAKIEKAKDLIVIGVTASYGKTSIKNFLNHILEGSFRTYATPRSVNTLGGIMKDINDDLPDNIQIYIVEMGAREKGDIAEISTFVNPHYAVVGKIGPAHIEYFKTIKNIIDTKLEILQSSRLKEAWLHESTQQESNDKIHIFGSNITNVTATLEGTSFELDGEKYEVPILGEFHAINLAAAISVAVALGVDKETIKKRLKTLKATPHRLQRIDAGGKLILDDSFNGNIDGMLASFDLASTYQGRKVVITPGLVEVDDELNMQIAKRANEVFDLVIVSSNLNWDIFKSQVNEDKLLKMEQKAQMQDILIEHTKAGDLILFANDAPSFV